MAIGTGSDPQVGAGMVFSITLPGGRIISIFVPGGDASAAQAQLRAKFSDATTITRNVTLESIPDADTRFPRLMTDGRFRASRDGSRTQFDVVSDDFVRGGSGATGSVSKWSTATDMGTTGGVDGTTGEVQGPIAETGIVGDVLSEEAFGGIPAFQRGLRERGTPSGIGSGAFGRFLSGRFNPAAATFLGQTALDPSMGGGPEAFTNFVRNTGGLNLGQRAQDVFSGLLNLQRGVDVSAAPAEAQRFLNPTEFADFQLFGDLAGEAARGRLGGFAASQLLPSSADLANQFLAGPTSAQTGGFGQFLRERLGSVI